MHNLSLSDVGERSEDNRDAADSRLFTSGGAIAKAELKIVNLKPGTGDDARIQFELITLAIGVIRAFHLCEKMALCLQIYKEK